MTTGNYCDEHVGGPSVYHNASLSENFGRHCDGLQQYSFLRFLRRRRSAISRSKKWPGIVRVLLWLTMSEYP